MDKLSQDKLDGILLKAPSYLDAEEIGFLRARRSYLSVEDAKKYASVLDENPDHNPKVSPEVAEAVARKNKRKNKKK